MELDYWIRCRTLEQYKDRAFVEGIAFHPGLEETWSLFLSIYRRFGTSINTPAPRIGRR